MIRFIKCSHCENGMVYIENYDSYTAYRCTKCDGKGEVEIEDQDRTYDDLELEDNEIFMYEMKERI